ncbi:LytTR family transcriptional regulator DNA-binding domain-containing protein [Adhaeribacter sp. BT258]|uniref:LytTR family transcriptional regulator DNA-binding domain-containing protein n=1 Tax=Adhaeribacter terrigena TaxID=2793070 RepID=A0ABS1C408_9BACT|nr:LytTR family transcriptional regulator DNA-binding domain-containing protein [Adhaeribacter terrigena]MBK0404131.1 LytTR family transcriptional regulator DNA-binding domain-containing protein [Adhaeribacter terrigena]
MKAVLIDDEPLARMLVKEYLQNFPQINVVEECNDGFEGLKAISQHQPDLVFLDVQMPKVTGFEMLELLEEPPAVIFTTAFDEYAIKAFDAHAVDYLLKPFSPERFNQAVEKFLQKNATPESKKTTKALLETVGKTEEKLDRVVVKTGTKIRIIPESEILFLEAEGDYINIHTPEGRFLKTKTMQYFEDALDPKKFVRIHRSYIIQLAQITKIEPYEKDTHTVVLKNGARLPVSRNGYAKLKQVLDF